MDVEQKHVGKCVVQPTIFRVKVLGAGDLMPIPAPWHPNHCTAR